MKIAIDIDGTICEALPSDYIFEAKPKQEIIDFVNNLYDQGHEITLYTARGMNKLKGQAHLIPDAYYEKTKNQLKSFNIKYHHLVFGKILYDILIDDKAYNVSNLTQIKENIK